MSLTIHEANPEKGAIDTDRLLRDESISEGLTVQSDVMMAKNGDRIVNRLLTSTNASESVLENREVPSQILISDQGADLIRRNKVLLRRIQTGELEAIKTMKGKEGYLKVVMLSTADGEKPFVIKYTSAVKDIEQEMIFFTPQVDSMRILQLANVERPVAGMNYLAPMIATVDISVTPYIEHSINLDKLALIKDKNDLAELNLDQTTRELLTQVFQHPLGKKALDFIGYNLFDIISPKSWPFRKVEEWVLNKVKTLQGTLLTKQTGRQESFLPHNTIIDLRKLLELLNSIPVNTIVLRATDYDDKTNRETETEFLRNLRSCCYVVELIVGYETIPKDITETS